MTAISDAIDQLRRHRVVARVGEPVEVNGATLIEIDIPVELPSRARAEGISATGVRSLETCTLVFSSRWPLRAPRPLLRSDFPRNLAHINAHRPGAPVPPCVVEGSLDELLHRFGLDAVVDQIIDWLGKAASGTLIDMTQGWEPTRRDSCPSTIVFSAERVIAAAPADGSVLATSAAYATMSDGVYCRLEPSLAVQPDLAFNQTLRSKAPNTTGVGSCAAFIARAPEINGQAQVFSAYQPDTVDDLATLLQRAGELGINPAALADALSSYYRQSVFGLQDFKQWQKGLYAIVVLVVQRPAPLVGSDGRTVEVLPYVVRYDVDADAPLEQRSAVHAAFHAHELSPELLARTSGLQPSNIEPKVVLLGCGSLGSKVGMHLARGGLGHQTFVDNESISPHNFARHALLDGHSPALTSNKAELMQASLAQLSHYSARAFEFDALDVLTDGGKFAEVVLDDARLIIDTTASLQVLAASATSAPLGNHRGRFARAVLFGQGRCAALILEGEHRQTRADDLTALLFECCRENPQLRLAIGGESTNPTRIFVGDNCRSLTTPMADALISRSAAMIATQLQRWLADGEPKTGQLCIGIADKANIGSSWHAFEVDATTVLDVTDDGGWQIRVLPHVAQAIDAEARWWGRKETGGAVLGRVSIEARTITVAGLVDAPPDSVRSEARFVLGTEGLTQALKDAHADSVGYLMFVGTWHSHPMGGSHSGIDIETLKRIATDARGLPMVSLVWTPNGLICAVDRL